MQTYLTGSVDDTDPNFTEIAGRVGIRVVNSRGGSLSHVVRRAALGDGWVLCCTDTRNEDLARKFGSHCVRIDRPQRLFEAITTAVKFDFPDLVVVAAMGRVDYRPRVFAGMQAIPGPLGFVKPAEPFAEEREVRMLWTTTSPHELALREFRVPMARRLCSRVS